MITENVDCWIVQAKRTFQWQLLQKETKMQEKFEYTWRKNVGKSKFPILYRKFTLNVPKSTCDSEGYETAFETSSVAYLWVISEKKQQTYMAKNSVKILAITMLWGGGFLHYGNESLFYTRWKAEESYANLAVDLGKDGLLTARMSRLPYRKLLLDNLLTAMPSRKLLLDNYWLPCLVTHGCG